jgi:MFS superfamily sulfate permease-like transporter
VSANTTRNARQWLRSARDDVPAAIVVFLVALPLCLGIALASGAPPLAGVMAGMVGGLVVATFSGSALSVSGPAAGLTVIVLSGIADLGSYPAFLTAVVLGGVLQVGLGLVRAGMVSHFVPACVVRGMLAAIGLILILKQIPHALGRDVDYEGDESFSEPGGGNTFSELWEAVLTADPGAMLVFAAALGALLLWTPVARRIPGGRWLPGPLMAVVVGTLANFGLAAWWPEVHLQASHRVAMPQLADPTALLFALPFPDFSRVLDPAVLRLALTLGLIASVESLLSVEAADKLDPLHRITPVNRELRAQGIGNIVSGLLGALPVTAVIVRSSANIDAGAKSKLSALLHGALLLLSALFLADWLNHIPLAALAAVLIVMGWKLARPRILLEQRRRGSAQFVPYIVTIAAILLTDLLVGVCIGILVGVFFVVRSTFRSALVVARDGDSVLVRFVKDVSFLNKPKLRGILEEIADGSTVIIDGTRAQFVDHDIVECIDDFVTSAPTRGITVELRRSAGSSNDMFKTRPPV